ncbi:MAG: hypothetical protein ACLGHC_06510 [Alphaproteobacteria bacterium]
MGHAGAFGFALVTLAHALLGTAGAVSLPAFILFQALAMICFAFTTSNLNAIALENMASIAGTASSVQGVIGTIGGAAIGFAIGQSFNGTVQPFLWGMAACALATVLLVILTEPHRLFARVRAKAEPEVIPPPPEDWA